MRRGLQTFRFALFLSLFLGFSSARAGVWESSHVWNEAFEAQYSRWIETSFGETFFLNGMWGGIKTDCADAVYGSRLVFSYLHGLPFVLSRSDRRFSNESTAFDHLADPVERVRAFLEFVNDKTWTGALSKHTYPVAIDRSQIVPGTIWLKPGHVETVSRVRETGVVEVRGSWLPGAVRKMVTLTTLGHVPRNQDHGFRRWIWPQNLHRRWQDQPEFDDMQFRLVPLSVRAASDFAVDVSDLGRYKDIAKFESQVTNLLARKIKPVSETKKMRIVRQAEDFCTLLGVRSEVVRSGYEYATKVSRCMHSSEYHAYSTPSRDANLRRVVLGLGLQLKNNLNEAELVLRTCPGIQITRSRSLTSFDFLKKLLKLEYSSNPHEAPEVRFGLVPSDRLCETEGTYGDVRQNGGS